MKPKIVLLVPYKWKAKAKPLAACLALEGNVEVITDAAEYCAVVDADDSRVSLVIAVAVDNVQKPIREMAYGTAERELAPVILLTPNVLSNPPKTSNLHVLTFNPAFSLISNRELFVQVEKILS